MKRRDFIQNTALSSAFLGLGGLSLSSFNTVDSKTKKLTILHTNDVHSYIDPFPPTHPKNPNMGGVARRAALIETIRKENPNVLLLDAGDIFQGTPYFNYYGGELEFKLMSMMKYDLATIGNHDFDNSIEGLYNQLPNANFEFVNANYDFKNTIMDGHVKPYKIVRKDGIKVGVFGIGIELEGLVDKKNYKETVYHDPVSVSQDMARILKQDEKCDLVICLSHIGYQYKNEPNKISDIRLATLTKDIDLIIGGHTHTFLDKPTIIKNAEGKDVLVNQVGCYGVNLGRIDFYFDSDVSKIASGKSIIV
jgi:5'-nucleotidase